MSYERLEKCPLCNSDSFHNHLITVDHLHSNESFAIVECDNCQLKFTNPRPAQGDIARFYKSDAYISHTDKGNSLVNIAYRIVRKFTLKGKLKLVGRLAGNMERSILDFGCGTGHFLSVCKANGWEAVGIEPDPEALAVASSKGLVIHPHYGDLSDSRFTIITLWHVLEHVHDIHGTLDNLKNRLGKKGYLVIAVPNCASFDAEYFQEYWAGYDVPRHLYHFEQETLTRLLADHELKIEARIPQTIDAYYISLLSNKYKKNTFRPFKSFQIGSESNKKGKKTTQYSSIIYIVRPK